MMCANSRVHYDLKVVSVCLHITLSRYHQYLTHRKAFFIKILVECVFAINSVLLITLYAKMGLCVFRLLISLEMIVSLWVLYINIIIKSKVWVISHFIGLGNETMACSVCLEMFLWADRLISRAYMCIWSISNSSISFRWSGGLFH